MNNFMAFAGLDITAFDVCNFFGGTICFAVPKMLKSGIKLLSFVNIDIDLLSNNPDSKFGAELSSFVLGVTIDMEAYVWPVCQPGVLFLWLARCRSHRLLFSEKAPGTNQIALLLHNGVLIG